MDFRVYSFFLDPVFVLTDDGFIQYGNGAAGRWLSLQPGEELRGKHIDEFVVFQDAALVTALAQLKKWEATPYSQTSFSLPRHGYQNVAKITAQCIPIQEDLSLYAVIIRDKVFVEALWQEDQLRLHADEGELTPSNDYSNVATPSAAAPAGYTNAPLLDTENLLKAMPKELRAQLTVRVVLNVPILKVSLKCQTTMISEEWIDLAVKNPFLKPGMRCMMEIIGSSEIAPFTCAAFVETYRGESVDNYLGRFKFDNLSASAKKIIMTYLEKNAIRL